jgi:phosphonate transport system substrate-binding protein
MQRPYRPESPTVTAAMFCLLLTALTPFGYLHATDRQWSLGVHPYLAATEIHQRFAPLVRFLRSELNEPVMLNVSHDYADHIDQIANGRYDLAYLGPASYVSLLRKSGSYPLLGRLSVNGSPTFRGAIIRNQSVRIETLADLRGKRFAFGEQESTMSFTVPYSMLLEAGLTLDSLAGYSLLGSHSNVALAVAWHEFDVGAVKEEIYEAYRSRGVALVRYTEPFSEHLFVASRDLDAEQLERLRSAFLRLGDQSTAGPILEPIKAGSDRIVEASETDYDNLRLVMDRVDAAPGSLGHKEIGE